MSLNKHFLGMLIIFFLMACGHPETIISEKTKVPPRSRITVQLLGRDGDAMVADVYGIKEAIKEALDETGFKAVDPISLNENKQTPNLTIAEGASSRNTEMKFYADTKYICQIRLRNWYLYHPDISIFSIKILDLGTNEVILDLHADGVAMPTNAIKKEFKEQLSRVVSSN